MPLSKSLKFLFIHIPKSGGTSFNQMIQKKKEENNLACSDAIHDYQLTLNIDNDFSDHHNLRIALTYMNKSLQDIFKEGYKVIVLLRDPFTRILSLYRYKHKEKDAYFCSKFFTFEMFVEHLLQEFRNDILENQSNINKRYHLLRNVKYYCCDNSNIIPRHNNIWYFSMHDMDRLISRFNDNYPNFKLSDKIFWINKSFSETSETKQDADYLYFQSNPVLIQAIKEIFSCEISTLETICPNALSKCKQYGLLY